MAISKKKTKIRACIFLNWSIRRFKRPILNIHVSGDLIYQMLYYYILIRNDSNCIIKYYISWASSCWIHSDNFKKNVSALRWLDLRSVFLQSAKDSQKKPRRCSPLIHVIFTERKRVIYKFTQIQKLHKIQSDGSGRLSNKLDKNSFFIYSNPI